MDIVGTGGDGQDGTEVGVVCGSIWVSLGLNAIGRHFVGWGSWMNTFWARVTGGGKQCGLLLAHPLQ